MSNAHGSRSVGFFAYSNHVLRRKREIELREPQRMRDNASHEYGLQEAHRQARDEGDQTGGGEKERNASEEGSIQSQVNRCKANHRAITTHKGERRKEDRAGREAAYESAAHSCEVQRRAGENQRPTTTHDGRASRSRRRHRNHKADTSGGRRTVDDSITTRTKIGISDTKPRRRSHQLRPSADP